MALFHVLSLGLLGKKKPADTNAPGPTSRSRGNNPIVGQAVSRDQLAATQLGATAPPDAAKDLSANTSAAGAAAARTRRRAMSGNAGAVTSGSTQTGGYNTGTPRSLIGS